MTLEDLNSEIINSNLINNWGGECIDKRDQDIPYGISVAFGEQNIYSYDDGFNVSGYMYINDISPTEVNGVTQWYVKEVIINVFQKKSEDTRDDYQVAIDLHHYLNRRKFDVSLSFDKTVRCEFCYFCSIVVRLKSYPNC